MNTKMKALVLSLAVYLLCTASNSPQVKQDSIGVHIEKVPLLINVPDTTIYDTPIRPNLDKDVAKMNSFKEESKKVLDKSLELQRAIDKEKEQKQIREAIDFLKKRSFKQVQ